MTLVHAWASIALLLSIWKDARGFPSYSRSIPNGERVPCTDEMGGCTYGVGERPEPVCTGVGHATCSGGSMPLNSFGEDLKKAGFRWTLELCMADSDKDGLTNGEELGDPCCQWKPSMKALSNELPLSHPGFPGSRITDEVVQQSWDACNARDAENDEPNSIGLFLEDEPNFMKEFRVASHSLREVTTDLPVFTFQLDIPECNDLPCQIVGLEAIIDQPEYVHHFILRGCNREVAENGNGREEMGSTRASCPMWIAGWVPGRDIFFKAPKEAGLPFGGNEPNSLKGWELEVHYNNPQHVAGVVDRSGFRMYYTTVPRPHQLGVMDFVKVLFGPTTRIPPGRDRYYLTQRCRVRFTETPIHLSSIGFHAHYLGREMHTDIFRNENRTQLWDDKHWDFDDQYIVDLDGVVLEEGDQVQATCIYDSSGRSSSTIFGSDSKDEMCQHTVYYYPAGADSICEDLGYYWLGDLDAEEDAHEIARNHPFWTADTLRSTWIQRFSAFGN